MKLKITVDGKVYEVEVDVAEPDPQPHGHFPPMAARVPASAAPVVRPAAPAEAGTPVANEAKVCRSPFAGTVSLVAVQPGQSIQPHDMLLKIEAMKMETVITAPVAGKVAKIHAGVGDVVQSGQVLVEFE